MKNSMIDFSEMSETARKIESLALMLWQSSESGGLTETMTEDAAQMIGDLATELRQQLKAAQAAQDTAA